MRPLITRDLADTAIASLSADKARHCLQSCTPGGEHGYCLCRVARRDDRPRQSDLIDQANADAEAELQIQLRQTDGRLRVVQPVCTNGLRR